MSMTGMGSEMSLTGMGSVMSMTDYTQILTKHFINFMRKCIKMVPLMVCADIVMGESSKFPKIMNFRNFNLKTFSMPAKYPQF